MPTRVTRLSCPLPSANQRLVVEDDRDERHGFGEGVDGVRGTTPQLRLRNVGAKDGDGTLPVADQHGQNLLGVWHEKNLRSAEASSKPTCRSGQVSVKQPPDKK
jgi:hypothetical protein